MELQFRIRQKKAIFDVFKYSMALRRLRILLILILLINSTLYAQDKVACYSSKIGSVINATEKRTIPGRAESEVISEYRITIKWKSRKAPEAFFWHPASGGWMNCDVQTVNGKEVSGLDFNTIKKGDILTLVPMPGGKYAIPVKLQSCHDNAIFVLLPKEQWYYMSAKSVLKVEKVIMQ